MIDLIKKVVPSSVKREIKLMLHKGDKFECPFCGFNAKDLMPIGLALPVLEEKQVVGAGKRAGGCYKCDSTDRERLMYVYLKEKVGVFGENKKLEILHIAPEKRLSQRLLNHGFEKYVCGDLFTEGYSYPDHVIDLSILEIPFDENTFDLIICNHVLEHVPDDKLAMQELYRVLKEGGKAVLQVPLSKNTKETYEDFSITKPKDRELAFGQFDHVRIYGLDYKERLASAGFKVKTVNISEEFKKYGLNINEDVYIGEK